MLSSDLGSGAPHLDPHACVENALPTMPLLQVPEIFLNFSLFPRKEVEPKDVIIDSDTPN